MRMNKILTAVCVLTAVSTVAVGISGVKIALADSSGYIMDSQKNQDDISFGKFGNNFDMAKDLSDEEQKKLFDEYKKSGIYNKDGVLYYQNKPVRCFIDTCRMLERVNEAGGKTITSKNICTYTNWDGTIDLYTVRKETANKGESSKTFGKIESVEQASSLGDMVAFVSAQSLIKITETGYDRGGMSAIYEILPFIPQESLSNLAKKVIDNGNYDEFIDMAGFLGEEVVAAIAETEYERIGISGVRELLPFLSQESVNRLAQKAVNNELFPFISQESIYALAKNAAVDGNYDELTGMAQFLSEEMISEIVISEYRRTGLAGVQELLPLMSQKSIGKLAKEAADKKDYDSLGQMAFWVNSYLLDDIAKELESKGESVIVIAPFMTENALKEVAESVYKRAGVSAIYELLPYLPKKAVNQFAQKAANQKDYGAVEKMASYASKKVMKQIAEKMLAEGKSIQAIEKYIK